MVVGFLAWRVREGGTNLCDRGRVDLALGRAANISTGYVIWTFRAGKAAVCRLQFPRRVSMMTNPASAIKREVFELIELQIETFRREGCLTDSDLEQYRARSGEISRLYRELDQIGRTQFDLRSARAS